MFTQKKGRVEINGEEPTFFVKYAGKSETFVASGKGCTHNAVQRIWDNSVEERHMRRMSIFINDSGMLLKELDGPKHEEPWKIDIKDISYCCAEKGAHERVFAWISKDKSRKKLFCHGVLCQSREKAQMMAIMLSSAFQIAYRDWKMKREREARQKSSTGNMQSQTSQTSGSRVATTSTSTSTMAGPSAKARVNRTDSDASSGSSTGAAIPVHHHNGHSGSDSDDFPAFAHAMAQMNIVEENEMSFSETSITIDPYRLQNK